MNSQTRQETASKPTARDDSAVINRFEFIEDQMAAILQRKTDAQRLRSIDAFWKSARAVIRAAICTEHPDWDGQMINREIARRISNGALDNVPN